MQDEPRGHSAPAAPSSPSLPARGLRCRWRCTKPQARRPSTDRATTPPTRPSAMKWPILPRPSTWSSAMATISHGCKWCSPWSRAISRKGPSSTPISKTGRSQALLPPSRPISATRPSPSRMKTLLWIPMLRMRTNSPQTPMRPTKDISCRTNRHLPLPQLSLTISQR